MGTRGLWGFVINGETKATYNHYDSYPNGLGDIIKDFIRFNEKEKIIEAAKKIRLVNHKDVPTSEDIIRYGQYYNENVNGGSIETFYALLREVQNNPQAYIDEDLDIMIDNKDFILDSLFCEWAYLINLDTGMFEIYKGFQKSPPKKSRYGQEITNSTDIGDPDYYPCEMIKEIPFDELSSFDMDNLEKEIDEV